MNHTLRSIWGFFVYTLASIMWLSLLACDNTIARKFGGTKTLPLPCDQKLVNITWKGEDELWYTIRPMHAGESAETYAFVEEAEWGLIEGKVVVVECQSAAR